MLHDVAVPEHAVGSAGIESEFSSSQEILGLHRHSGILGQIDPLIDVEADLGVSGGEFDGSHLADTDPGELHRIARTQVGGIVERRVELVAIGGPFESGDLATDPDREGCADRDEDEETGVAQHQPSYPCRGGQLASATSPHGAKSRMP